MLLTVAGVHFRYHSAPVLENVSLVVSPGEFWAVLGNNGAGKSTLLRCMNRVVQPVRGAVLVDGRDVKSLSRPEVARQVGYVPQKNETASMTVFDAVLLGRLPHIGWRVSKRDLEAVERALDRLGLQHLAARRLDELSGGELQKTVIARAIAQEPRALLLDEPTANLDLCNQLDVMEALRSLASRSEMAVVAVMHDLNLALRFADAFLFMSEGRIRACGGAEVVTPEVILDVYGVDATILTVGGFRLVIPLRAAQDSSRAPQAHPDISNPACV